MVTIRIHQASNQLGINYLLIMSVPTQQYHKMKFQPSLKLMAR